jgi:hypothetical protein
MGVVLLCGRCGRPLLNPDSVGGRCIWLGCKKNLCEGCFKISKFRFCREHMESGTRPARPAWPGADHEHFPDVNAGIRAMHEGRVEGKKEKARYYASEYWRFLSRKVQAIGPPDWTPRGVMKSPSWESGALGDAYFIKVSSGRWPRKKVELSLIVIPCDWSAGFDRHALDATVRKAARGCGGYGLVALAGDGAPMEAADFANRFSDSTLSLYLAEPRKGHLNYNIKSPVTRAYSEWFSQKKEPRIFRDRVKAIGRKVDGRSVVSAGDIAAEFGFREEDVPLIIKSCGFLHPAGEGRYYVRHG